MGNRHSGLYSDNKRHQLKRFDKKFLYRRRPAQQFVLFFAVVFFQVFGQHETVGVDSADVEKQDVVRIFFKEDELGKIGRIRRSRLRPSGRFLLRSPRRLHRFRRSGRLLGGPSVKPERNNQNSLAQKAGEFFLTQLNAYSYY